MDIIKKIIARENTNEIFNSVLGNIYNNGPISITDLEILTYLQIYAPQQFELNKNSILNYMGLFYKNTAPNTLKDVVFRQYRKYIRDTYQNTYTPVQANIINSISNNNCFSFSAPTSTGKSYLFMDKIINCNKDVVVIVPSRALINEYYLKLCNLIPDKSINVLTFIDKINTKYAKRNIFVVTPERCRELFRQKDKFEVEIFLFDEAQLSNEDSKRGLYFDSIVRRCQKAYPKASFIFAHPFVKNPEAQIEKNHFKKESSDSKQYTQKNVGQVFMCTDKNMDFYHFGIDKSIMGKTKVKCDFDPIEITIKNKGSILFYVSKSKIYKKDFLNEFQKYIALCEEINNEEVEYYIEQLKNYTGGDTVRTANHFSQILYLLKRGIVIHHGSLPLQTRILIEEFTKKGYCRLCFATSTLEQGINMPFDVVFLDRLDKSKPLSVKNMIGRAGRSTMELKFDYGYVIINGSSKMSNFRTIMQKDEVLDNVSSLEKKDSKDDDYNDFKDAILKNTYSDEFNLTEKDLKKLTSNEIDQIVKNVLDTVFKDGNLVSLNDLNKDEYNKLDLYSFFKELYEIYLGRILMPGEENVLNTAIKIILWRVYGKTFKNICWYRYSYASKSHERDKLKAKGKNTDVVLANFFTGYNDIPDKNLENRFSLFDQGTKANDIDYDLIMYDTYDFIDKLIGFKLSDVFYATFFKYYEKTQDIRANILAKYIKYGTSSERNIWMLRYGLSFEDIEILDTHIENINAEGIVFRNSIEQLTPAQKDAVKRFIN